MNQLYNEKRLVIFLKRRKVMVFTTKFKNPDKYWFLETNPDGLDEVPTDFPLCQLRKS